MGLKPAECIAVITVQHEGTYVKVVYTPDLANLVKTRIEKHPMSVYTDLLDCQRHGEVRDISDVSMVANPHHGVPVYHGLVI
jgi:hypothetical protein